MNILMVHPHDIYSSEEPWTVRIVYIAKEFIKKGHTVKLVYFPLVWDDQGVSQLSGGVTVIPFTRRHGPLVLISNIIKLFKLAGSCDVIHFQKCFYHAAIPAMVTAFFKKKPLHYDWDDWEVKIYEASTQSGYLRNLIRWFLNTLEVALPKCADTVSVASARLWKECEKIIFDNQRIFEAHVGADLQRFHPAVSGEVVRQRYALKGPLVLYLGQLHGGQYVELFIETAAKLVHGYRKDLSFMIVGDGYRAEELKKLANRLMLAGGLIFAGSVPHEDVPQYIAAADVCVACFEQNEVTSCKSPLKIVEYLSCGKAIVASSVGEVPGMLQEAGILAKPGDVDSLAAGIVRLLQDANLRNNLERLARQRAEKKYNWTVTAGNILNAYEKAIQMHSAK